MKDKQKFQTATTEKDGSFALNVISWLFGMLTLAIGTVNAFWGNDRRFGVFIFLLSFIYFLPINTIFKKITDFSIPKLTILKILLGIFNVWAAMGVGELFDKIALMSNDF